MVRWFDEVHLSRHPIAEIGTAFYIREMLGNGCTVNVWDLRSVIGPDYAVLIENLRRSGVLRVVKTGCMMKLTVVAPGDRKRERCRLIARKKRKESKS